VVLLTRDVVVDALQALVGPSSSIVLGRSSDGGFYLAGFNRPPRFDWSVIVDRRARAADALVAEADQSGATLSFLPTVDDVDSYADALRLIALRRTFTASRALVGQLISILLSAFAAPRRALTLLVPQISFDHLRGPPQHGVHA
jgi:hypothetical protein